jgi:L-asparaginase II
MFQALPFVEDGVASAFDLTAEELALCTASHNAEPFHVDAARRILAKAGVSERALACGPHAPMFAPAAAALEASGTPPTRIHNNCSGKHAGMLALAAFYEQLQHPAQQRVVETLVRWTGVTRDGIATAIDGCALPTLRVATSGRRSGLRASRRGGYTPVAGRNSH